MNTKNQPEIDIEGNIMWKDIDGKFHREDGPAIIKTDGSYAWFFHGVIHRNGGPAIESILPNNLSELYTKNNIKHQTKKTEWFNQGFKHRIDGPAVEDYNGDTFWYLFGELHREDGPAVEYHDGKQEWFIHGTQYEKEDFEKLLLNEKLKSTHLNNKIKI